MTFRLHQFSCTPVKKTDMNYFFLNREMMNNSYSDKNFIIWHCLVRLWFFEVDPRFFTVLSNAKAKTEHFEIARIHLTFALRRHCRYWKLPNSSQFSVYSHNSIPITQSVIIGFFMEMEFHVMWAGQKFNVGYEKSIAQHQFQICSQKWTLKNYSRTQQRQQQN